MRLIPRTMSTQHPDNATVPLWAKSEVISGDDEVVEAYYVFSNLGPITLINNASGWDIQLIPVNNLSSTQQIQLVTNGFPLTTLL